MDILFLHPSFPGQFARIAPVLASTNGISVCAMGDEDKIQKHESCSNIPLIKYKMPAQDESSAGVHIYAHSFNNAIKRATVVADTLMQHKYQGYEPDIIFVHPGWGDSIFLKEVYPHAKIIGLLEYYYHLRGADVGFDKEFPHSINDVFNVKALNAVHALALDSLDHCFSPTNWQRSRFPKAYQADIDVIHDGIDTDKVCPDLSANITLSNGLTLSKKDEVITFVSRDLEPYRGYHKFMRALPEVLRQRPNCQVIIVGGDGVSYGRKPPNDLSWKALFLDEVRSDLDLNRVTFTGKIPYKDFLKVLQISSLHVYLTYPFVLSWSMLEAMSVGCPVIGSHTAPVEEVIEDGVNGYLVPFEEHDAISHKIIDLLGDRSKLDLVGKNARETIINQYDFNKVCLPKFVKIIQSLL